MRHHALQSIQQHKCRLTWDDHLELVHAVCLQLLRCNWGHKLHPALNEVGVGVGQQPRPGRVVMQNARAGVVGLDLWDDDLVLCVCVWTCVCVRVRVYVCVHV